MTDAKYHTPESGTLAGRVFHPSTADDLAEAVELAFDYRGDVTLRLTSGEEVTGYLFNRSAREVTPTLNVFPADGGQARTISYSEIASIAFTGKDTATGKSWEAWVSKKESDRRAERDQVAEAAKARGHL